MVRMSSILPGGRRDGTSFIDVRMKVGGINSPVNCILIRLGCGRRVALSPSAGASG